MPSLESLPQGSEGNPVTPAGPVVYPMPINSRPEYDIPGSVPPEIPQPPTPGYTPSRAEEVAGTQNNDPTNLDPTPDGTEQNSGGNGSVVIQPGNDAAANPDQVLQTKL